MYIMSPCFFYIICDENTNYWEQEKFYKNTIRNLG